MSEGNLPNGAAARLEAVQDGKPWIKRFTKKEYAQAFAEYTARFGPLYEAALAKPGINRLIFLFYHVNI